MTDRQPSASSLPRDGEARPSAEVFERIVRVSPAYDERDGGYGVSAPFP